MPLRPTEEIDRAMTSAIEEVCSSRRGGVVLLEGAAGAGKTRLLGHYRHAIRLRRVPKPVIRSASTEEDPRGAVTGALARILRLLEPHERNRIFAGCGTLADLGPRFEWLRSTKKAYPLRDTVVEVLRRMRVRDSGLILMVDDLHLADDWTLETIALATRALLDGPLPFLLIGTYRPEALDGREHVRRALENLAGLGARTLQIGPLSREDFEAMVRYTLGLEEPMGFLTSLLRSVTRGNPRMVVESLKFLTANGHLVRLDDGGWDLPDDRQAKIDLVDHLRSTGADPWPEEDPVEESLEVLAGYVEALEPAPVVGGS
jgi:hypothetical protein